MENHPPTPENPTPSGHDAATEDMIAFAAECVDFFETRFDGLDYSEASLAVVEELLGELSLDGATSRPIKEFRLSRYNDGDVGKPDMMM